MEKALTIAAPRTVLFFHLFSLYSYRTVHIVLLFVCLFRSSQYLMPPPKTYMRVRRRRNAGTALTLRLDGLLREDETGDGKDAALPPAAASRKRSAMWRRVSHATATTAMVEPSEEEEKATTTTSAMSQTPPHCRVVEAILSESDVDEDSQEAPRRKRRRLTLVQSSSSPRQAQGNSNHHNQHLQKKSSSPNNNNNKKKGLKILHPVQRLVDESLQAVAVGTITPQQHANFIWSDSRVSHQAREWLAWRNAEIGTILHAAALWNDAELCAELLRRMNDDDDDLHHHSHSPHLLVEALDGEGRTPYEVAELAGHEQVQEVMEAFGADTKNFVYDWYCLVDDQLNVEEATAMGGYGDNYDDDGDDENQVTCLLKNGMGFWNQEGELMLEREYSGDGAMNGRRRMMMQHNEEEEDSNDEDWQGNDYPEEGFWAEENSEDGEGQGRRGGRFMDDDDDDDDGEFDVAYDYAYGMHA